MIWQLKTVMLQSQEIFLIFKMIQKKLFNPI